MSIDKEGRVEKTGRKNWARRKKGRVKNYVQKRRDGEAR